MVDRELVERVAAELDLPAEAVAQTVALLAEGGTAPFLARYRRERTGGLAASTMPWPAARPRSCAISRGETG